MTAVSHRNMKGKYVFREFSLISGISIHACSLEVHIPLTEDTD